MSWNSYTNTVTIITANTSGTVTAAPGGINPVWVKAREIIPNDSPHVPEIMVTIGCLLEQIADAAQYDPTGGALWHGLLVVLKDNPSYDSTVVLTAVDAAVQRNVHRWVAAAEADREERERTMMEQLQFQNDMLQRLREAQIVQTHTQNSLWPSWFNRNTNNTNR